MTTVGAFILVLGGLVIVHEFGHFILAKLFGIRVERFCVGFGPVLLSKRFRGTEYALAALPLGGYVKLTGENPEEELAKEEQDPAAFSAKPPWMRIVVYLAGPAFNLLFAVMVVWAMLWMDGEKRLASDAAIIGELVPGEPAQAAGILPQDRIFSVDSTPVTTWLEMSTIIRAKPEEEVALGILRKTDTLNIVVKTAAFTLNGTGAATVGKIGVYPVYQDVRYGPIAAFGASVKKNVAVTLEIYRYIGRYVRREVPSNQLGGPIAIAQMAGESAKMGFSYLILFMALISVNLAIVNLLPIPVADGGQILLNVVQWIMGRPLSVKLRMGFQVAGLAFLLILFVFVTVNDIGRLLQ